MACRFLEATPFIARLFPFTHAALLHHSKQVYELDALSTGQLTGCLQPPLVVGVNCLVGLHSCNE